MTHTAQEREPTQIHPEWFGLLAGPIIWSLYFLAGYLLVEFGCRGGWLTGAVAGLPAAPVAVLGLTVAALAAALWATASAARRWRALPAATDDAHWFRAEDWRRFMVLAAVLLGGLFSLLILMTGVPALILDSGCTTQ